jgi:hypothetical protein
MKKLASTLHDATHLVPGVPAHGDTPATERHHRTRAGHRPHDRSPRLQHPDRHHQAPPRILITWQNWIGRHVGHASHERG